MELGPQVKLVKVKLVGIAGKDIHDGNPVLTLGESVCLSGVSLCFLFVCVCLVFLCACFLGVRVCVCMYVYVLSFWLCVWCFYVLSFWFVCV